MMDDDDALWELVTKTIKPLPKKASVKAKPIARKKIIKPKPVVIEKQLSVKTTAPSPLPARTVRKLKQQKIPVQAKLDLHGMTIAQAHQVLSQFIITAYGRNLRCVEIVTGRGNPEKGTGQLRRHVPIWLHEDIKLSTFILHCEENPVSRGGSFLIMLRRSKTRT